MVRLLSSISILQTCVRTGRCSVLGPRLIMLNLLVIKLVMMVDPVLLVMRITPLVVASLLELVRAFGTLTLSWCLCVPLGSVVVLLPSSTTLSCAVLLYVTILTGGPLNPGVLK